MIDITLSTDTQILYIFKNKLLSLWVINLTIPVKIMNIDKILYLINPLEKSIILFEKNQGIVIIKFQIIAYPASRRHKIAAFLK